MSRNDWERGTIILPSAAVAPLKKQLRDFTNRLHADVRARAVRIHKEIRTTSVTKYRAELTRRSGRVHGGREAKLGYLGLVEHLAYDVLEGICRDAERGGVKLHQATVADVEQIAPKATNRTTVFAVHDQYGCPEASIDFDGRKVTWDVMEGNRNCENARASALGGTFFDALRRVTWTRGSGGVVVGNDEYNEDSKEHGGGANYIVDDFGPLGEAERAYSMGMTPQQYRKIIARPARSSHWW